MAKQENGPQSGLSTTEQWLSKQEQLKRLYPSLPVDAYHPQIKELYLASFLPIPLIATAHKRLLESNSGKAHSYSQAVDMITSTLQGYFTRTGQFQEGTLTDDIIPADGTDQLPALQEVYKNTNNPSDLSVVILEYGDDTEDDQEPLYSKKNLYIIANANTDKEYLLAAFQFADYEKDFDSRDALEATTSHIGKIHGIPSTVESPVTLWQKVAPNRAMQDRKAARYIAFLNIPTDENSYVL